ncbi:signal peptidase II [Loktanella ponticola]|uniref:Lipoprotein signal peptidase n=1 Tax=Yoonia ponticola TaxID=1524255 RepID=A0A7W9BHF8_9RHOB|nr:signal peptidase II [Yoonia ponticola]MBB5720500.1 signal peptidase II [Yoonia ponticola]
MRPLFWTAFWIFLIDQLSKYYVLHWLKLDQIRYIDVAAPFLTFRMAWNRGVNFGLGAGYDMRWALIGVALAISIGVIAWLWKAGGTRNMMIAAGLLVGGAMGNIVDRVMYGAVADFLNMSCCGIDNPYAFNVADISIFAGAIGLAFLSDSGGSKPSKKSRTKRS